MRTVVVVILILIVVRFVYSALPAAKPVSPFSIVISCPIPAFHTATPLIVRVKVTNISAADAFYCDTNPIRQFRIYATDESGNSTPLTDFGRSLYEDQSDSTSAAGVVIQRLKPGQSSEYKLIPNAVYDMSNGLKYRVCVERDLGSWSHPVAVSSNVITVEDIGIDSDLLSAW
ncbi:MAG TPA: hypothetical protein VGK19_19745 [Capsulimonadaceae bacterium]|jgi:hypothetical protein